MQSLSLLLSSIRFYFRVKRDLPNTKPVNSATSPDGAKWQKKDQINGGVVD